MSGYEPEQRTPDMMHILPGTHFHWCCVCQNECERCVEKCDDIHNRCERHREAEK